MRFDPYEMPGLLPEWQSEAHLALAPADSLLWARIVASLRAGHYDRRLAFGADVHAGTPLAIHAERLTSVREREAVARAFRRCISDAHSESPFRSGRIEVNAPNIVAAEEHHRLHHAAPALAAARVRKGHRRTAVAARRRNRAAISVRPR